MSGGSLQKVIPFSSNFIKWIKISCSEKRQFELQGDSWKQYALLLRVTFDIVCQVELTLMLSMNVTAVPSDVLLRHW